MPRHPPLVSSSRGRMAPPPSHGRATAAAPATPARSQGRAGRRRSFTVAPRTRTFAAKSSPGRVRAGGVRKRLSPARSAPLSRLVGRSQTAALAAVVAAAATTAEPVSTTTTAPAEPPPEVTGPLPANIRVAVRVRPENAREMEGHHRNVIQIVDERLMVFDPKESSDGFYFHGKKVARRDVNRRPNRDHKFAFDVVFGPNSTNGDVFAETTRDLVGVLFSGYNCSVFVYGATGAGKTHTMLGTLANPGLTYRTVLELYERLESKKEETECEVAVSYLEIYNEMVVDLMNPGQQLNIREDGNSGVNIPGLSIHRPDGPEHLLKFLQFGNSNRTQHPTDANAESSRSHAVFQVYLKQKDISAGLSADVKVSKLSMIDLAGSERGSVTHARGGARLREGANINKSLLALGNCINALAEGSKYIPYRNSKLTRLLKDSIGGNCRTVMISNVSPSSMTFEDTYNTLKYADRAKRIKVKLTKNVRSVDFHVAQYAKIVEGLKLKIVQLEAENEALKSQNEAPNSSRQSEKAVNGQGTTISDAVDEGQMIPRDDGMAAEEVNALRDENASLKERLAHLEAGLKAQAAGTRAEVGCQHEEMEDAQRPLDELLSKHLELVKKCTDVSSAARRCFMKKEFAGKILDRSALIALDSHDSNEKIEKFVGLLAKRYDKAMKREKKYTEAVGASQKELEVLLQSLPQNPWHSRCVKAEAELTEKKAIVQQFLDLFRLTWDEHNKLEDILKQCLPQLKSKHLLLSSHGNYETENKKYLDLVAKIQCTRVQFNPSRLEETSEDSTPQRLGPILSIATDFSRPLFGLNQELESEADEDVFEEPKSLCETTFVKEDVPQDVNFSLNDNMEGETSGVNSTFVLEDQDSHMEQARPPTPPRRSSPAALAKENHAWPAGNERKSPPAPLKRALKENNTLNTAQF